MTTRYLCPVNGCEWHHDYTLDLSANLSDMRTASGDLRITIEVPEATVIDHIVTTHPQWVLAAMAHYVAVQEDE